MAHQEQLQFVKSIIHSLPTPKARLKILEIGSYDVNGSVRKLFPNTDYIGTDLIEGPGVDLIGEGSTINLPSDAFDITLSCECFEHNPNWKETLINMSRMTKPEGIVLFTCATTGRPEHGTTRTTPKASPGTQSMNWDYYRNLTQMDFESSIDLNSIFHSYFFIENKSVSDLYFFGKRGSWTFPKTIGQIKTECINDLNNLQTRKANEKFIPKPLRRPLRKLHQFLSKSSNPRLID